MKIKGLVLMGALLMAGFLVEAKAADLHVTAPTYDMGIARSDYAITNSTVAVSSQTCTTLSPAGGGLNIIAIANLGNGTTMFYRADGSSTAVATTGLPIYPNTTEIIETPNDVNVTLAATVSSRDARVMRVSK